MNFSRQRVAERRCTGSAERCVYTNGPGNRRAAVLKGLPDQVRRGSHEVFRGSGAQSRSDF
jgi:hypothetical protein